MKARLITILLVALSTATCFSRTIIHTKGGKAIKVKIRAEMSKEEIQQYDEQYRKQFPEATCYQAHQQHIIATAMHGTCQMVVIQYVG